MTNRKKTKHSHGKPNCVGSEKRSPVQGQSSAYSRLIAATGIAVILVTTAAIFAQRGQHGNPSSRNETSDQSKSRSNDQVSTESLNSPSQWSKEYIHGPAGKVIATEERIIFTDVDPNDAYYDDIYRIAARGVTLGCGSGIFCPNQQVTREQMAAFIIRALGEYSPPTPSTQRFTDVPPSNIFYNFIDRLAQLQITQGCSTSPPLYCPTDNVTHEQMSAFMCRAIGVPNPPTPPLQPTFCDVPTTNIFYSFIEYYANSRQPIIWPGCGGVGSGTTVCGTNCSTGRCFCPSAYVTRREMAHILVKAFGI